MANYVIILAAGEGTRFGGNTPKCFLKINKKPVYQYSLELFTIISQIKQIVLVVPKQYKNKLKFNDKKIKVVCGGKTRNQSFELGLKTIKNIKNNDKIIIHDAARINVEIEDILKLTNCEESYATLCCLGKKNNVDFRIGKYNIQTPQMCQYFVYKLATKNPQGKDLFSYLNLHPKNSNFILSSNKDKNFKITFKKDLQKAKSI